MVLEAYFNDLIDSKWTTASGMYNNNPALAFDAVWQVPSSMSGGRIFRIHNETKAFYVTPTDFEINSKTQL